MIAFPTVRYAEGLLLDKKKKVKKKGCGEEGQPEKVRKFRADESGYGNITWN